MKSPDAAIKQFGNTITAADLKKQLYIVAGPGMEGRETGTAGQRKAADYIRDQFKAFGLQPGANGEWFQYYSLFQDVLESSQINIGGTNYEFAKDFYASLKDSKSESLTVNNTVLAGYADKPLQGNYKGKAVVFLQDAPQPGMRRRMNPVDQVKDVVKDAKVVMFVMNNSSMANISRIADRLKRSGLYMGQADEQESQNVYFISETMAAAIFGQAAFDTYKASPKESLKSLESKTPLEIELKKKTDETKSSNVLGYLEGTDKKDEIVFITAHYDHLGTHDGQIYYGADDDGSGTVSVIEMAQAFTEAKKAGHGPRRSMVFMTVSGEEKGLLGSRYYTEHPIYPLEKTVVDLNIDMVGRVDPAKVADTNYIYIIGDDKLSSELRPISEAANKITNLELDYKYNDPNDPNRFYYRSDHYMFAQHNIPIIFYFNGVHEDYHKPTDTVDKIHYELMAKRAQLVFYTAWEIANREDKLPVDRHEK
ncbi:peptidase M28 [Chitinophaga caeni]|uniref:Peptidase M28 n=2 Tax=Chitinophaga caeni TaxID=2029983 RepID=A0A291R0T4_9BACT|nr:peptidase M28 [Chitinophaga caeni]